MIPNPRLKTPKMLSKPVPKCRRIAHSNRAPITPDSAPKYSLNTFYGRRSIFLQRLALDYMTESAAYPNFVHASTLK